MPREHTPKDELCCALLERARIAIREGIEENPTWGSRVVVDWKLVVAVVSTPKSSASNASSDLHSREAVRQRDDLSSRVRKRNRLHAYSLFFSPIEFMY